MPDNIVLFPGVRALHAATVAAAPPVPTVRFTRWKQRRLPLAPHVDTLDERIQDAKTTCAWHEDQLRDAGTREAKDRQLRAVTFWNQRVLDLVAERARATAQPDLLPPNP